MKKARLKRLDPHISEIQFVVEGKQQQQYQPPQRAKQFKEENGKREREKREERNDLEPEGSGAAGFIAATAVNNLPQSLPTPPLEPPPEGGMTADQDAKEQNDLLEVVQPKVWTPLRTISTQNRA